MNDTSWDIKVCAFCGDILIENHIGKLICARCGLNKVVGPMETKFTDLLKPQSTLSVGNANIISIANDELQLLNFARLVVKNHPEETTITQLGHVLIEFGNLLNTGFTFKHLCDLLTAREALFARAKEIVRAEMEAESDGE